MKVGVLTFHWAYNYGALLQAYSLCKALTELGHTPRIIDYVPPNMETPWWRDWGLRRGFQAPARALKRLRYDRFRSNDLPLTPFCRTQEDLEAVAHDMDAVIVGSDQVWNGNFVGDASGVYFLDFVNQLPCKKVSYAACFGQPEQPPQLVTSAKLQLPSFDSLSVRDEMSAALVRELSGRNPQVVLDPTMLGGHKDLLESKSPNGRYIAAYLVSRDHTSLGLDVVSKIKAHLQMPVVVIGEDKKLLNADKSILSAGPVEWVRLFRQASFVCTDSFHGTLFATKFRKPFITWSNHRPDRISTFLSLCGLEDHLVNTADSYTLEQLLETPIDYQVVEGRLKPHIERSRAFLAEALAS